MFVNRYPKSPHVSIFVKYPAILAILGFLFIVVGSYGSITLWNELQETPTEPAYLSLEEALPLVDSEGLWVSLKNVKWDCRNIVQTGSGKHANTYTVLTNIDETIVVQAWRFSGHLSCEQILTRSPSGILRPSCVECFGKIGEQFNYTIYKNSHAFLDLCTFCGRNNTNIFFMMNVVMFLFGTLMFSSSFLSWRRQQA
jgi:hypothetical protein